MWITFAGIAILVVVFAVVERRQDAARENDRASSRVTTSEVEETTTEEESAEPTVTEVTTTRRTTPRPTPTTTVAPPPPVTTTVARRDPNAPPYPDHAGCRPASDGYVAIINGAFADSTQQLRDPFEYDGPRDIVYVGANIYRGEERLSSADVWAVRGGVIYALSSDARRRTMLADGRDILDASAGDEYATAATDCVGNAAWERNQTGGR